MNKKITNDIKTRLNDRYNFFKFVVENIKDYEHSKIVAEAVRLKHIIMDGCGNIVDSAGDCMYYSNQGTARYCSTCKRRLDYLNKIIKG